MLNADCGTRSGINRFGSAFRMGQGARWWVVGALLVMSPTVLAQQDASATTQPATVPAVDPAPATRAVATTAPTTPREAYRALVLAVDAGDGPTIQGLLLAEDDVQRAMAQAVAGYAEALSHLRRVATVTYGALHARVLAGDREALETALVRIDAAEERIDGNHATLTGPDGQQVLATLQRVGEGWKVPIAPMISDLDEAEVRERTEEIRFQTRLLNDLGVEIVEGKFQTSEEAAQVLRARLMRPATESTAPSGPGG